MEIRSAPSTTERDATEDHCKISKLRNYASQIYAASATNIVKFTTGSFLGFTTVIVAELYSANAEIYMSVSDLSWFSSSCFIIPVGCLFLGMTAQKIGNRLTMMISMTLCAISYLIFYFATSSEMLLGAQALAGLIYMTSVGPGITYVIEITQPQLRSALTASTTLSTMFAAFLVVFLSNFLHWRMLALVMLVFPIIAFIAVYTIPESPHWLAGKNKFADAESSLCWLRGWSSPENVALEFNALKDSYTSSSEKWNSLGMEENQDSNRLSSFKANVSSYLHGSFYLPLSFMCLLFLLHGCTGYGPLITYCIVIFRQVNAPIDAHMAASIFDALRLVGAVVCISSIHYTGKKKLVYITLIGAALAHLTASTALLLKGYEIYPDTCQWITAVAMMCTAFFTSAGIDKVVYMLNAEVFPTQYRNLGSGIGLFISTVMVTIGNKLFLPLLDIVTLSGIFAICGIFCIITCISFHCMFPETEGKTLQQIEQHFEGVRNCMQKKKPFGRPSIEANATTIC